MLLQYVFLPPFLLWAAWLLFSHDYVLGRNYPQLAATPELIPTLRKFLAWDDADAQYSAAGALFNLAAMSGELSSPRVFFGVRQAIFYLKLTAALFFSKSRCRVRFPNHVWIFSSTCYYIVVVTVFSSLAQKHCSCWV